MVRVIGPPHAGTCENCPPISWFTFIYCSLGHCCWIRDGFAYYGCPASLLGTQGNDDSVRSRQHTPSLTTFSTHRTPSCRMYSSVNGAIYLRPPPPLSRTLPRQTNSFPQLPYVHMLFQLVLVSIRVIGLFALFLIIACPSACLVYVLISKLPVMGMKVHTHPLFARHSPSQQEMLTGAPEIKWVGYSRLLPDNKYTSHACFFCVVCTNS